MTLNRFGGRRLGASEEGAAAVEFAIISTVLFVVLFAIIEFGIALNQYQIFTQAAREGARKAAVRATTTEIQTAITDAVGPGYTLTNTPAITVSVDPDDPTHPCDGTNVGADVTISWDQQLNLLIPFIPDLSRSVSIRAVFRCE